jgi:hypothetical protein
MFSWRFPPDALRSRGLLLFVLGGEFRYPAPSVRGGGGLAQVLARAGLTALKAALGGIATPIETGDLLMTRAS